MERHLPLLKLASLLKLFIIVDKKLPNALEEKVHFIFFMLSVFYVLSVLNYIVNYALNLADE